MTRIEGLLDHPDNVALNEWFEAFHGELRVSINDSITTQSAIDMMARHLPTRPVFEALFEHYRITRDRDSGILNDPNDWFEDPRDPIAACRRIVQASVEVAVVESLPCPLSEPEAQGERP